MLSAKGKGGEGDIIWEVHPVSIYEILLFTYGRVKG